MAEAHREEIAKLEALYAAHPEGRVFTHLAEAYRRAGELNRAREILEDGLRRHPDYSSAHVVFGRVLVDLEDAGGAAAAFRRVLDLDRHNLVALRSLGDLAEKSGDTAAAIGYYRDLMALDPTDDRLRLTVARLEEGLATASPEAASEPPGAEEPAAAEPPVEEPAPWAMPESVAMDEPVPAIEFPELSTREEEADAAEEETAALSFPSLDEGESAEAVEVEGRILEVEGLSLGWDVGEAPPEGFDAEEPAVDDAMESPGLVPDAFAGMGWTAGDAGDTRTDEERMESDTAPVGEEALGVDDAAWATLGERAEAAWGETDDDQAEAGEVAAGDDVEEITTWGPPLDELPDLEAETEARTEPSAPESAMADVGDEGVSFEQDASFVAFVAGSEAVQDEYEDQGGGAGAGPAAMVTATMAELYAQQGFYDRAVDVYRQLLDQVPEDERLRDRLAEMELLSRAASEEAEAGESDAEAASVWTGPGGVAGGEETPYAWADSASPDEGQGLGRSAGAYFRSLLAWRPGESVGRQADDLLDLTDEHAAQGGTAEPEVALETGAVAAAFEEWFGEGGEERGAASAEGGKEGEEAAEEDADLAMFRSWLQSLKK